MAREEKILFSVQEASDFCGVDPKTMRKELEAGRIPGLRMGRNWKIPAWWIKQQRDGAVSKAA